MRRTYIESAIDRILSRRRGGKPAPHDIQRLMRLSTLLANLRSRELVAGRAALSEAEEGQQDG